ncbi:MAG: ATP-binding cassette domain-containing protein [Chloroflexi bacterium]|nr:ATP-binding cassette domain-containing protein [Chloroflexota bacterium]
MSEQPLLKVEGLKKYFPVEKGFLRRVVGQVKAVDDVSLEIQAGETLGLVGESGSGKTTVGRCILRALDPTAGSIQFQIDDETTVDMANISPRELRDVRRHANMIFQDPFYSLDPRWTILDIVGEPLKLAKLAQGKELEKRVAHLMDVVGLEAKHLRRYPHAFSGGQRQRIGVARALATNPRLIIADEPVSALDVSTQAQILNLLNDLQSEFGLSYLFIAHDLSVVEHISDRVAVMYVGKLVEVAPKDQLFFFPKHPYTEALLSASPTPNPDVVKNRIILPGEIANPADPPAGCYFHPRCRYAQARCQEEEPRLREISPDQWVSCHFAEELELIGAPRPGSQNL